MYVSSESLIRLLMPATLCAPVWVPILAWPLPDWTGQRAFRFLRKVWLVTLVVAGLNCGDRSPFQWDAMFLCVALGALTLGAGAGWALQKPEGRLPAKVRSAWKKVAILVVMAYLVAVVSLVPAGVAHVRERLEIKRIREECDAMSRQQLRDTLRSPDLRRAEWAAILLLRRDLSYEDRLAAARLFADASLPWQNRQLVRWLFGKRGDMQDVALEQVAPVLEELGEERQLWTAQLICDSVVDAPPRFEVQWSDPKDIRAKHAEHVPKVKAWWAAKRAKPGG